MNILQVTWCDTMGRQFNGDLICQAARRGGHTSHMAVATKLGTDDSVLGVGNPLLLYLNDRIKRFEDAIGLHALLPVSSLSLYRSDVYRRADVIHLQLVHASQFFSLLNILPMASHHKLVWTMHDPWLATGHCVYPMDCMQWLHGCKACPDLDRPIPSRRDRTSLNWKIKKWLMKRANVTLVVASEWMLNTVRQSPILSHLPCHLIPFGVDPLVFYPRDKAECRLKLGIPVDAHVLVFRSVPSFTNYKGTEYIEEALARYKPTRPTWLVTFEGNGGLGSIRDKYKFVELGWVDDQELIATAMSAADLFLMPSVAEAFGLMAIEAMACGTPVIVFEGTSLPAVIRAPEGGRAVPYRDSEALSGAIAELLADEALRRKMTENCARITEREYSLETYLTRHLDLYSSLINEEK